jgi:alpha-galactosidase
MPKIAMIGAGSVIFCKTLVNDILATPALKDSEICLMSRTKPKLDRMEAFVKRMVKENGLKAKVWSTLDRREALRGAKYVIVMIQVGGLEAFKLDYEIPLKYGVDQCIGDSLGPGGIFRALRTIPVMVGICRDMERLCPDALLLNYTNPMAMLCRAMQRASGIQLTGLCHSVQGTAGMLANWLGAPMSEITYVCAGINHQSWYIQYRRNGKDAIPALRRKVATDKKIYRQELVRNEMFLNLGYYVTESSGHNSEYNWWFRKRPDLIRKYCSDHKGAGWNPGTYAYILKEYLRREREWKKDIKAWFAKGAPIKLERGHEYAAHIMNAVLGGEPFEFNGNVPNTGIVTNLPPDACVEVPVVANRRGLNAIHVGALPPQCAALNNINIASEEMAVEAALTGDADLAFQSVAVDPLSAAVLSLGEIRKMVAELLAKNRAHLPQFKSVKL